MSGTTHYEELRLALVLNGGVSLAVWIGGVCHEVNRLVRKEGVYKELLALTQTDARVDVICGTSAGSVNGAVLAMALAHGRSLEQLRKLWLDDASFRALLRDPLSKELPSLLDGDGYFLGKLEEAFQQLHTDAPLPPAQVPLELIVTTTLLSPETKPLVDDLGLLIRDATHKATFRFSRGPGYLEDPFSGAHAPARLALAARSSASFPGAFEASYCRVGGADDKRPDMRGIASFDSSRWVIDGGVLDNKPIEPALKAIFAQRANREVRRVLFYVVPDPGVDALDAKDGGDTPPNSARVVLASLTELPRVESVSDELAYIREHNRRVEKHRRKRLSLTSSLTPEQMEGLARTLFPIYRARRVESAVQYILNEIDIGLAERQGRGLGHRGRRQWLARALSQQEFPWVPVVPPTDVASPGMTVADWQWGTRPTEMMVRLTLDALRRIQHLVSALRMSEPQLAALWARAFDVLGKMDRLRDTDRGYWRRKAQTLDFITLPRTREPQDPVQFSERVAGWCGQVLADWKTEDVGERSQGGPRTRATLSGSLMYELAELFMDAQALVPRVEERVGKSTDVLLQEEGQALVRHVGFFVPKDAGRETIVRRLLQFSLVEAALGEEPPEVEQLVELVQVSADAASPFGGPRHAADKLAGIQLGHFGAFYKRSWRANDWMYGRLDAVHRYVNVLLHPERLRSLYAGAPNAAAQVLTRLEAIAVGNVADPDARSSLQQAWNEAKPQLRAELAYLDEPGLIVPELLPACAEAVIRRLHLEIIDEELPGLAQEALRDIDEGADPQANGRFFAAEFQRLRGSKTPMSVKERLGLFSRCRINAEKIRDEVGSDLFTATSMRALSVAVSAFQSSRSGLGPLRKVFLALRVPVLVADLFAQAALKRTQTMVAATVAAVTFGLTVLALKLFSNITAPDWLINASLLALFGGLVGMTVWSGWLAILLMLAGLAGFIALQYFGPATMGSFDLQQWRLIALVSSGVLLLQLLGSIRWKRRRSS